jgi:hypothetical protein
MLSQCAQSGNADSKKSPGGSMIVLAAAKA